MSEKSPDKIVESPWGKLRSLKTISDMTGGLHDAQITQLKLWPYVAAPHLKNHEFTWDIGTKEVNYVFWYDGRKKPPKNYQTLLDVLDSSVKDMLGEGWCVIIESDGETIFPRKANTNAKKKTREKTTTRSRGRNSSGRKPAVPARRGKSKR